jgi:hypothetical protein
MLNKQFHNPGGNVVELSTHDHNIKGSNPTNVAGRGKLTKWLNFEMRLTKANNT